MILRALLLGACGVALAFSAALAQGRPSPDVWMVALEGRGVPRVGRAENADAAASVTTTSRRSLPTAVPSCTR